MNKSLKFALILAAITSAATAWGAALVDTTAASLNTDTTGTATSTVTHSTILSEDVTIKLSKNVQGAFDLTKTGGTVGVATGTALGRGFIYPNGTSTTSANVSPIATAVASIGATALLAAATAAAS